MAFPLIAPLPASIPTFASPHPAAVAGAPFPLVAGTRGWGQGPRGQRDGDGEQCSPQCLRTRVGLSPRAGMDTDAEGSPLCPPSQQSPPWCAGFVGFVQPGTDRALQEGFLPCRPPLCFFVCLFFTPFYQHFSLFEGEEELGFSVPSMFSVATEILPPGTRRAPSPVPGHSARLSHGFRWDIPAPGWEPARGSLGPGDGQNPSPVPQTPLLGRHLLSQLAGAGQPQNTAPWQPSTCSHRAALLLPCWALAA